MKKSIGVLICIFSLLVVLSVAQDLNTVTVSDQFDSGSRGNASGSGTSGAANPDGTEYLDITNTDGVTGTIRYINSWAGATSGETESPVIDVTVANDNQDRELTGAIPAIAANSRPGATSGQYAVLIGDDGGFNALFLGESDDSNYYIAVDVYCEDRSSETSDKYEMVSLCARAGRDNDPDLYEYCFNMERAGSYSVSYDAVLNSVYAVKWTTGNSPGDIVARTTGIWSEFGSVSSVTQGWHTFRIECLGVSIKFYLDGTKIADVTDYDFTNGRPGIVYREGNFDSDQEHQGRFDNLRAGPKEAPPQLAVGIWTIYE